MSKYRDMYRDNPIKPKSCCETGSYECQITMPINGRVQCIDYCISHIVAALNAANIETLNSCCGHDKQVGSIILSGDMELIIRPFEPSTISSPQQLEHNTDGGE